MYRADLQKVKCVWPHKHSDQSSDCKNCQTGHKFKKRKNDISEAGLSMWSTKLYLFQEKKQNWNNKMTRDMLQLVLSQNKIREQFQLKLSCSLHH